MSLSPDLLANLNYAVILPCYNEEAAIAAVVADFRAALPGAHIYVYDNASTDETATIARAAGAVVRQSPLKGKGHVIRQALAEVEADIYLMADGDGTYEAAAAPRMIDLLLRERLDMVTGVRRHKGKAAYRTGHQWGNRLFTEVFRRVFRMPMGDVLSGYRVFSRRFVKTFPSVSRLFEVEIELSAHAAFMRLPVGELETIYAERAEGSQSKLKTWRDGSYILFKLVRFLSTYKPFLFFGSVSAVLTLISLALGLPVVFEFLETGMVPRFPTAILATGIIISAVIFFAMSLTLDVLSRYHAETKRLAYLRVPVLPSPVERGND
ncbi:glycosyltransferase [Desulforhopalus vacuolatus]|uniref:glycosyltransferase n=1 Tax=Desulforhopalus vacuolatus TaxID=40414 RepID=UPI001964989C|nr:glycosyltransferase [Desulforhopalus vacuolatus]MBM9520522.1 glycosyltransferase [Desulforhopalus vacuolatus]